MAQTPLDADLDIIAQSDLEVHIDPLTKDVSIIQKLDDEPNDVGGLSAQELKAKFDEAGNIIKGYINDTLVPQCLSEGVVENLRKTQEAQRQANESARQSAESARASAESQRQAAESARASAESARQTAETEREKQEASREETFQTNQTAREKAFDRLMAKQTEDYAAMTDSMAQGFSTAQEERKTTFDSMVSEQRTKFSAEQQLQKETFNAAQDDREAVFSAAELAREDAFQASQQQRRESADYEESLRTEQFDTAQAERDAQFTDAQGFRETEFAVQQSRMQEEFDAAETARNAWGEFDLDKEYHPPEKVYYQGSSYICTAPCDGTPPPDPACWQIIARKGTDGDGSGISPEEVQEMIQTATDGLSPYEYAKKGGFTGTPEEFQAALGSGPWLPTSGGTVTGVTQFTEGFSGYNSFRKIKPGIYSQFTYPDSSPEDGSSASLILEKSSHFNRARLSDEGTALEICCSSFKSTKGVILDGIATPDSEFCAANKGYVDARMPSGVIVMWSGQSNAIPDGWALCDGNNGTPNLKNRFVVGAGLTYEVGATGGEAYHKLLISEMPKHLHNISAFVSESASRPIATVDSIGVPGERVIEPGDEYSFNAVGGDAAHNNLPPYYALCYIMKL